MGLTGIVLTGALVWLANAITGHPRRFLGDLPGWGIAFFIPFGVGRLIRGLLDAGPPNVRWTEYLLGLGVVTAVLQFSLDRILERPPPATSSPSTQPISRPTSPSPPGWGWPSRPFCFSSSPGPRPCS